GALARSRPRPLHDAPVDHPRPSDMGRPRHRRRVRDRGDRVAHVPRHRTGGSRDTPGGTGRARRETAVPLELFLDLVIVFAFTQVTSLLSADPSWTGVVDGLLLLSVLWWAWAGFARLTNAVDPEEGVVRIVILGAIGAMLVMSLAAPHAFGRDALTFAIAYVMVRALHVGLSGLEAREAPELRGETLRLVPNAAAAGALLLVAGVVDGGARLACWAAVALVSFLGPLLAGGRGWEISPAHFVERFGQVILIALGESVVAIGIGAQGMRLDGGVIAAALLVMTAVACLWWAYFDWVVYVARARLTEAAPPERAALARDVYSYLHFPMVGGIVLFAFGLKTALHGPRRRSRSLPHRPRGPPAPHRRRPRARTTGRRARPRGVHPRPEGHLRRRGPRSGRRHLRSADHLRGPPTPRTPRPDPRPPRNTASRRHPTPAVVGIRPSGRRPAGFFHRSYRSTVMSSTGWAQHTSRSPSAGASSGSGE